jgi:C_GCAxxG_C_C family probable redox protein
MDKKDKDGMAAERKHRTTDEIVMQMIELAEKNYNCSQIMMIMALQQEREENPGLVRAMSGLGDGCGFFQETCGIMTGAASVLSWYAGKGADSEKESEKLLPMLQDLGDWFRQEIGTKYSGTRCRNIAGDLVGTPEVKQICGGIILQTYKKVNEILEYNHF